jgi:hypothetical protein
MRPEARALLLFFIVIGCGAEARDDETTGAEARGSLRARSSSELPLAHDGDTAVGEPVCLPVAACNMFVSCALAQPERDAAGTTSHRVLSYDHHPKQVGSLWQRDKVCWAAQAGGASEGCADALLYTNVPCTPMPSAQLALGYKCELVDRKCVVGGLPAPSASAGPASLGAGDIEKVVRDLHATARAKCWDTLANVPGPSSAKVTVRFTIEPSGATSKVGASGPAEYRSLHFGLGMARDIEEVLVVWPDGTSETVASAQPRTRYRIGQGDGVVSGF